MSDAAVGVLERVEGELADISELLREAQAMQGRVAKGTRRAQRFVAGEAKPTDGDRALFAEDERRAKSVEQLIGRALAQTRCGLLIVRSADGRTRADGGVSR